MVQARAMLDALLAKYADEGVFNLDDANVLRMPQRCRGSTGARAHDPTIATL